MNIYDYLKWRGDLSFKADPFNEVDNFVISFLSYTKFDKYLNINDEYTIKEISDIYFKENSLEELKKDKSFTSDSPLILKAMAESNRYRDAVIKNFYSVFNEDTTEQFCAFELKLSDNTSYIVFRGTDDTIIGWQEDFNLSYMVTPSQISASNYLKKVIKPFKKYRIGGHSKGGNLALYAVISNPKLINQIINVYSNDGPGINFELLDITYEEAEKLLEGKYVKYVPEDDIIGTIFTRNRHSVVVKSSEYSMLAHSLLSWQVEGNKAIKGQATGKTELISNAFKEFIENESNDNKKLFVDELFNAIKESGIERVSDVSVEVLIKTIKNMLEMNKDSKETGKKLLNSFIKQYKDGIQNEIAKKLKLNEKAD